MENAKTKTKMEDMEKAMAAVAAEKAEKPEGSRVASNARAQVQMPRPGGVVEELMAMMVDSNLEGATDQVGNQGEGFRADDHPILGEANFQKFTKTLDVSEMKSSPQATTSHPMLGSTIFQKFTNTMEDVVMLKIDVDMRRMESFDEASYPILQ